MYFCKQCGFLSHSENVKWCGNPRCLCYGSMLDKYNSNDFCEQNYSSPQMTCSEDMQLGFATVPFQKNCDDMYSPSEAIKRGTVFRKLDMPWKSRLRRK